MERHWQIRLEQQFDYYYKLGALFITLTLIFAPLMGWLILRPAEQSQITALVKIPWYAVTAPQQIVTYHRAGYSYSGTPADHRNSPHWPEHKKGTERLAIVFVLAGAGAAGVITYRLDKHIKRRTDNV